MGREIKNTKNLNVAIAAFEVETSGEKIMIIRIADHFAWRWDNPADGKSYGDFVIQPKFKEPDTEKRIKELMEQVKVAKGGHKLKLEKKLQDIVKFYEDLKIEDAGNLLSTLTLQADDTIAKIKGE